MKKYIPLRDKLIVRVDRSEEKSKGGIIIAHEGSEEAMKKEVGVVLAIGKSCFYDTHPEDLQVGDKVAFARYAGKQLGIDEQGFEVRTMRDIDVLCVIEDIEE